MKERERVSRKVPKKTLTKQKTLTIFYRELNDGTDDLMIQNQSSKKKDKKMHNITTDSTETVVKSEMDLFIEKNGSDARKYSSAQHKEFLKLLKEEEVKNSDDLKAYNEICTELGLEPSKNVTALYTREVKSKEKVVRIEVGLTYHVDKVPFHITSGISPKTEKLAEVVKNRHTKFVMALNAIES